MVWFDYGASGQRGVQVQIDAPRSVKNPGPPLPSGTDQVPPEVLELVESL